MDRASNDVGPSRYARETCVNGMDPCKSKHKIFLSHSGAQKDFTEHLWKELKRFNHNPFFDKDIDSLRKGEKFYPPLKMAAENCRIAILVLSKEFFTATKWPMMELDWFIKAQKLDKGIKILPLFLEISREEMEQEATKWVSIWEEMKSKDPRINVEEWQYALTQIPGNNGLKYGGISEGHATFIEKVVKSVCILLPPDVMWDMSNIRSSKQLSKPILERVAKVEPSNKYQVLGLYGVGGIGKTTISRVIYNEKFAEFGGKVCYIELGGKNLEDLQKIVLRELTEWREDKDRPIVEHDKLSTLLKQRMHQQKVFLILDNVWDYQIDEAKMYLNVGYHCDSMVLVISRSLKILEQLGIRNCDCMDMPELDEEGAIDFFLFYAEIKYEEVDLEFVKRCVQECYFRKIQRIDSSHKMKNAFHYHPLALKVLGKYFGSLKSEPLMWNEKLEKFKAYKLYMLEEKDHAIFSVLRLGFDILSKKKQLIFLDLALIWNSTWSSEWSRWRCGYGRRPLRFEWDWLCRLHSLEGCVMKEIVNEFHKKGLLDSVYNIEKLEYNIHDLYLEFAKLVSQSGTFDERRFLIDESNTDVPQELKDYPSNGKYWPCLERLIICWSTAQRLETAILDYCERVEVLVLDSCKNLEEVNVSGMVNLRCVVVSECHCLKRLLGLEKLSNLIILRWDSTFRDFWPAELYNIASLEALQILELRFVGWPWLNMFLLDLSGCTNLLDLTFSLFDRDDREFENEDNVDFGKYLPKSILKINFSDCPMWIGCSPISSMSSLTNLQGLDLEGCTEVMDLTGVCELISLQKLNVAGTEIHGLPDGLKKLKNLQVLDVSGCYYLKSIVHIVHATTLQHVDASRCSQLRELPDDFSFMQKLEVIDLRECTLICELPGDYERLAGHSRSGRILKVEGCWGLIVPLVAKLQCPEESHADCIYMEVYPCCYRGGISMQSWIDVRKNVNGAAFDLLKCVLSGVSRYINMDIVAFLNLDEREMDGLWIRALCELDDRSHGIDRFANVIGKIEWEDYSTMWSVLATAPCTLAVVMKKARLEPWNKTLFHSTITRIMPALLRATGTSLEHRWK